MARESVNILGAASQWKASCLNSMPCDIIASRLMRLSEISRKAATMANVSFGEDILDRMVRAVKSSRTLETGDLRS